ncbi:NmrA/HSCARG family protein [Allokutzneria sp. NRRL B-24872]|uniref:NmrA/HSCARG family protein n=1 Tax=Allokutzneria sp. NRRL B-24872 TaxID=1137961 RepID=UPI001FEE5738|nr:NmrA/HSCARG family protein [Allokutzneria sp. NRRL B-24872]
MKMSSPIAVTGATGVQGGALATLLLDRGQAVRALTRDPTSTAARALRDRGAEVVRADFDDPVSLAAALSGSRAMFLMSTPFGTDAATEIQQGIAAIDAAVRAEVQHVVFSSVAHADRRTGVPHFDSKWEIERYLARAGLAWTVLGPAKFMDNYATGWAASLLREGRLVLPLSADRSIALVCAADIAGMAALALAQPERFAGVRIDIAGDQCTPAEQAASFAAVLGRPVAFERVQAQGYGDDLAAMFEYFDTVGLDVDTAALRAEYPEVGWRTFDQWLGATLVRT